MDLVVDIPAVEVKVYQETTSEDVEGTVPTPLNTIPNALRRKGIAHLLGNG